MNKEQARKLYSKIDIELRKKKIKRYELAEKIGVSKQCISDSLLALKDGKFIKIEYLLKFEEVLGIKLIDFN